MSDPKDTRTIYERIDAAYKEIAEATFIKNKRSEGSNAYSYIGIDQILAIVRQAHAHNGVKVIFGRPKYDPAQFEYRRTEVKTKKTPYGESTTTWQIAVGHIKVRIIGQDEKDCIETTIPFEAKDNSDKLTNKILTNAERGLYRVLYAIDEGGNDTEEDGRPIEDVVDNRGEVRRQASNDRFFGKKDPVKDKPKPKDKPRDKPLDDYAGIPNEEKRAAIVSWQNVPLVRERIDAGITFYGPIEKWRDTDVVQIYNSCRRDLDKEGQA